MSAFAVIDHIPRLMRGSFSAGVAYDRGLLLNNSSPFAGAASWPHIDELFAARSLDILATASISGWYGAGGCRRPNGRLSFETISSPAHEIVRELARTCDGFRWTDDADVTWAVRFADNEGFDSARSALAVSYRKTSGQLTRNSDSR